MARQVAKMQEYAANGVRLAWLVIPATREIHVYRAGQLTPEIHLQPTTVSADPEVLPDFHLDLAPIW